MTSATNIVGNPRQPSYAAGKTLDFTFIVAAWSLPVIFTLLSVGDQATSVCTLFVAIASVALASVRPKTVFMVLPFFALLAPIGGFYGFSGFRFVLTDWLFVLLTAQIVLLIISNKKKRTFWTAESVSDVLLLLSMLVLFIGSTLAGLMSATLVSGKSLLYAAQFILIYLYSRLLAQTEETWLAIINAWVVATFFAALVLIEAYLSGKLLVNFALPESDEYIQQVNVTYLVRASYFYAGFHFVAGIASQALVFKIAFAKQGAIGLLLNLAMLVVLILALIVMANKSALIGLLLATLATLMIVYLRWPDAYTRKGLMHFFVGALALPIVVYFVSNFVAAYSDRELLSESLVSAGSLETRFEVWYNAFAQWFTFLPQIFVGMGPNFFEDGNQSIAEEFKVSIDTDFVEGAIDSGWLSYLMEVGILFFSLLMILFIRSMNSLIKYARNASWEIISDSPFLSVFGGLVFTAIALSTQSLGYSKVAWLPFQLILIGLYYHSGAKSHVKV